MAQAIVRNDDDTRLAIELPPGYRRVFSGAVKPGDQYLDLDALKEGRMVFVPLPEPRAPGNWGARAEEYDLLIRRDASLNDECERCHEYPKVFGERYCVMCGGEVREWLRRKWEHR